MVHSTFKWFLALALSVSLCATAQARGLLRDAGTEFALDTLARPLMSAASLPGGQIRVLVINDMSLNAFVADGRAVFIHAGLILKLQSAAQLQAVIAHEIAHIANGHTVRRSLNAQNAQIGSMLGLALGLVAGAASGEPGAAIGLAAGAAGSARGVFFSHTREEETAADRSGMRYLARSGIDPGAMFEVLSVFAGQEDLIPGRQDPYLRTHPLSRDRARAVAEYAEVLGPPTSDQAIAEYWFDRMQAKLSAYLRSADFTFRRHPASDTSDAGRIARALAHSKLGQSSQSYALLDAALEDRQEDPYLHELKGWIAVQSNQWSLAVDAYTKAAKLAPRESQVLAGYGRALLALDTPETDEQALEALQSSRAMDRFNTLMLRDLATAYAKAGNTGMASLRTAERYAMLGDGPTALIHARRAENILPTGSPGWSQAQDIIQAAEAQAKARR
ncbi:MAG: M48 family metalloprotease [Pseudomonadota bacterium]